MALKYGMNDRIERLFSDRHVYLQHYGQRNRAPSVIQFNERLQAEPYSLVLNGGGIMPERIGLSSYILTALPDTTRIGRYSSVAVGAAAFAEAPHPQQRFSTSPITLDNPSELAVSPAKVEAEHNDGFKLVSYFEPRPPIFIGNDVWIGQDVLIKPGTTIGDGAIVGQRSVVTKDVQPYAVVAGVPAVTRRQRFSDQVVAVLLELKWWNYAYWQFKGINADDPIEIFVEKFQQLRDSGQIAPYHPEPLTASEIIAVCDLA